MIEPTDADRAEILKRYRWMRSQTDLSPHSVMCAIRDQLARSCMTDLENEVEPLNDMVRYWIAASNYVHSINTRPPLYWYTRKKAA